MTQAAPPRSLAPREHGAYGQLAAPMVAALAAGRPGLTSVALVGATAALFFAHEPVVVLRGGRGPRARAEHGGAATRRLRLCLLVGLGLGAVALARAPRPVWEAAAVAAALGLATLGHLLARVEKTLIGELVASSTLAAASAPLAVAGGVPVVTAWWMWSAWALGFAAVTCAVRDVIARGKRRRTAAPLVVLPLTVAGAAALTATHSRWPLCAAPLVAVALALVALPAAPRRLRQTGWLLMVASLATAAWLVVGHRSPAVWP